MSRIECALKRMLMAWLMMCALPVWAHAASTTPKSIRIYPDLEGIWFLDGKLEFGCEVTYANGGKRRTSGYLNGNLPWKEVVCESDQAIFSGDEALVDLFKVSRNNNTLLIKVHLRNYSYVKSEFEIKLPPLSAVAVFLSPQDEPRYGKSIEPWVDLTWANGAGYTYQLSDPNALISPDSVQLYFNDQRIFGGRIELPAFQLSEPHVFSLAVMWSSKHWLNDVQVYPYRGKEHEVWRFKVAKGAKAREQGVAPKGMDGAEGFHGLPGADAPEVKVHIRWNVNHTKLIVEGSNGTQSFRDEFAPQEFSLEIIARGGDGGDGGRGGEGGAAPFDDPYRAGIGGKGGRGGRGGKGAVVTVTSDPDAETFIPCIIIDAADGLPGRPGRGGKGGVFSGGYGPATLPELLFPARNYDGEPGDE